MAGFAASQDSNHVWCEVLNPQSMRSYRINQVDSAPPHTGEIEGTSWESAPRMSIDQFNWYESGPQPATHARMLYDDASLHVWWTVEDHSISSSVTTLNGPTHQDSSVELFADVGTDSHYFNFEVNCCGYFLLAWQPFEGAERDERRVIDPESAEAICITSSVDGPTKEAHPDDMHWWLVASIPFSTLSMLTEMDVSPATESTWRGNVYRSGVESSSQLASWNAIKSSEPDYHQPSFFGGFQFG